MGTHAVLRTPEYSGRRWWEELMVGGAKVGGAKVGGSWSPREEAFTMVGGASCCRGDHVDVLAEANLASLVSLRRRRGSSVAMAPPPPPPPEY